MNNKAYAVSLHELLAGVPRGARLEITDPDGMGTRFIPVGRYCHEAAEALRVRLAQLNDFNPDWDAMAVMVEEQQRMAKRIEELTQLVTNQGIRLMDAEAQPEQKPVAWKMKGVPAFATSRPNDTDSIKWDALYTAPPQREWQGLTEKEILADDVLRYHFALNGGAGPISKNGMAVIAAVNAKLKEKNA